MRHGTAAHHGTPVLGLVVPAHADHASLRVDGLNPVEARADRQVLEHGRQPELAELRTLGSYRDQVEFRERLLAGVWLDQQDLGVKITPLAQGAAEAHGERRACVPATHDDHSAPGIVARRAGCSLLSVSMRLQSVPMHSCPKRRRWE